MPIYHTEYGDFYVPRFYEDSILAQRAYEIGVVDVDYVDLSEPQPISDPARLLPAYHPDIINQISKLQTT